MKYLKSIIILFFIVLASCTPKENASEVLTKVISNYENRKGYDEKQYPLGLFTKEYYKNESEYAQKTIDTLSKIAIENLTETENISLELLKFTLQEN
ncbi:MAG TPA: hypothetical protein VLM44_10560, partial [Lutibacter sp.]|nr:hypothetical protein [Lutibacter sp.]